MKLGVPSWKMRRRAVFSSLVFGMLIVAFVAVRQTDTGLNETLALGGFGLIGAVVAAYIGGAAYEDVRLHRPQRSNRSTVNDDDFMEDDPDVH